MSGALEQHEFGGRDALRRHCDFALQRPAHSALLRLLCGARDVQLAPQTRRHRQDLLRQLYADAAFLRVGDRYTRVLYITYRTFRKSITRSAQYSLCK